jgi:hypothetical protein
MTTNLERYVERHEQICRRAEREFVEQQAKDPMLTVAKMVTRYAAACRQAIAKRDDIASVFAISACHVAMKAPLEFAREETSCLVR